jgi:hypothetical protein
VVCDPFKLLVHFSESAKKREGSRGVGRWRSGVVLNLYFILGGCWLKPASSLSKVSESGQQ